MSGTVTQNVDGLHAAAGSRDVIDLHGRLDAVVCLGCGDRRHRLEVLLRLDVVNPGFRERHGRGGPHHRPDGDVALDDEVVRGFRVVDCRRCGGVLKPDVVFFGEHVPRERFQRALALLDASASLLVLGSSLTVGSGYRFVTAAIAARPPVAIVNRGVTRGDGTRGAEARRRTRRRARPARRPARAPGRGAGVTTILLTNDDGIDSPALLPFADALDAAGEVRVCVPDRERSWIGKAVTRTGEVTLTADERGGRAVWACSGYPADATQLGIHALGDGPPDLVVSGINLGFNHGAAFLMSSGTVGAAIEGWISGVRAIAFSTGLAAGSYTAWREHVASPAAADAWRHLAATCVTLLGEVEASGLFDHADVVSVNLPFDATPDTPRRITSIARVGYERLFRETPTGSYTHDFNGMRTFGDLAGTDVAAAEDGAVSITPVRLPHAAEVPAGVRRRLEG